MGWYGLQIAILLVRGPHCKRSTWFGYEGGIEARKSVVEARNKEMESGSGPGTPALSSAGKEKDLEGATDDIGRYSPLEREKTLGVENGSPAKTDKNKGTTSEHY